MITDSTDKNETSKMINQYNLLIEEINVIKKKSWILFICCSFRYVIKLKIMPENKKKK